MSGRGIARFFEPALRFSALVFAVALLATEVQARVTITVVYPREGQTITATDSTFIFGQVSPPTASLTINGTPVPLYPNGTYLAYLPVHVGPFAFRCRAVAGAEVDTLTRHITVRAPLESCRQDSLVYDPRYVFPNVDAELLPGELIKVSIKATPGCSASFAIEGVTDFLPMAEQPPARSFYWGEAVFGNAKLEDAPLLRGIYTGVYRLQPGDTAHAAAVRIRLVKPDTHDTLQVVAPGTVTVWSDSVPRVGKLRWELTVARTGPGLGYDLFFPEGVRVELRGRVGGYYRVWLSDTEETWVPVSAVKLLPAGTLPPESVIQVCRVEELPHYGRVHVFTHARLPFRVRQISDPPSLVVTFYGATAETDWIRHEFPSQVVREVRWFQRRRHVYDLTIELKQAHHWGYDARYEGDDFVLDIKKAPRPAGWPHSPLRGLTVLLDPGHFPDLGAVGPDGYQEKDANLSLALVVKRALESKGATVFLTRDDGRPASLRARPILARVLRPDILLSLHHNALPDGVNPFENHGTSTYYYHPQSYELAVAIQKYLLDALKFKNFGLYYDNLALCRPTQMPAVLTEPGFMMYPPELLQIESPEYRKKVARAVVRALEEFVRENAD
ncbi:MAG: N-acetylmuramoyl-L-alanine amidase [Calditrichaeota bacterium]|nr:N-acetylmuramoyl-L-alanine amidase [Calditrichota bacterium]